MFFETILPVLAVSGYVFLYRAIQAPPEYTGFAVLGGAMTAFWLNVLWSMASQLYWDTDQGNLELYVVSSGPLMAVLLGMALGGLVMTTTRATVIIVVCSLLFGVTYQIGDPLLLSGTALGIAAIAGLGLIMGAWTMPMARHFWSVGDAVAGAMYLFSGAIFPLDVLPVWLRWIGFLLPVTYWLEAARRALLGSGAAGFTTLAFSSPTRHCWPSWPASRSCCWWGQPISTVGPCTRPKRRDWWIWSLATDLARLAA